MSTTFDRWWLWAIFNFLGMALFLHFAVQTWIEPELANEPGASGGEFIVWGISALPIFLIFMLAQLCFGLVAHRQAAHGRGRRGEVVVGFTLLCWIAVFLLDNAHHGS